MNKKLLVVAVAAAFVAPLSAHAELKLSGAIQAEVGSLKIADGDRETRSSDGDGALAGGGPNKVRLDFDEKLDSLTAFGRADWSFNTADGSGLKDREHFVGLKGSGARFKFGRIEGVYKSLAGEVDPLYTTGAQARANASGMTAGTAFSHSKFVDNVVELGYSTGGLDIGLQTTVDEKAEEEGSVQFAIKYSVENWGAFLAGAYHDFDVGDVGGNLTNDEENGDGNGKIGGWYKMPLGKSALKLGLQYEFAEEGALDGGQGDYILGSAAYNMGAITVAGWVAAYMGDADNEDALSFSLAGIYSFSKRTMAYLGYHDTNSDNNTRDWDVIAAGIRHSF